MARTKPYTQRRWADYDNLSASQKERTARRENRDAASRQVLMEEKRCKAYPERGVDVPGLPEESMIPDMIDFHQWQWFIRDPPQYDEQLVKEFYRDMVPAAFADKCLVTVRGVTVEITPERINAYHGTPDRPELDSSYGLSKPPEFRATFNPVIASSLRRDGDHRWDTANNTIMKNQLHYDLAFMLLFVKTNLRPSTHSTTVDSDVARILYSLQHNHLMDVGHIIWLEMVDAGNSLDGVLPFPCMITQFCVDAHLEATALRSSLRNFNITYYNTQIRISEPRQERQARRPPAAAARRRNVAPRDDDDNDDEEVPPGLPRDTPAWGRMIFQQVVTGNEANRVANEANRMAIEGMQERMDSMVAAMAQSGIDVSNVPERQRRRTRRRPTGGASTSYSHPDDDE